MLRMVLGVLVCLHEELILRVQREWQCNRWIILGGAVGKETLVRCKGLLGCTSGWVGPSSI